MSAQMQLELTDPQTEAEALAKLFRQKRVLRGLKQCHVAPKLGVSPAAVSSLESVDYLLGRRNGFPSKLLIARACAFYELDFESISARMLKLKIATGQGNKLIDGNHCGKRVGKHAPKVVPIMGYSETWRDVDEFDLPSFDTKPGIFRSWEDFSFVVLFFLVVSALLVFEFYNVRGFWK